VVVVLLTAGDQVPAIFSFDVGGSVIVEPLHTGPIGSKVGVDLRSNCYSPAAQIVAHADPDGVNV
jgi:hypothetical protein